MGRVSKGIALGCWLAASSLVAPAHARPSKKAPEASAAAPTEAQQRFQRALELYQEGNLDAARAELRRAYETAPTFKVLYNLGQVEYELHDYPAALGSFEKYLAEGGAKIPEPRRLQVEADIEKLKARVARIDVSSNVPQADVLIDDVAVGLTPFATPVQVSAGRRKVTVAKSGYAPVTRWIDLAGGDLTELEIDLADEPARPPTALASTSPVPADRQVSAGSVEPERGRPVFWGGWIGTGALAIAGGVTGALAYAASRELRAERSEYPISRAELDQKSNEVRQLSLAADICGGAAIATAAITLFATLSSKPASPERASVRLVPGPTSLRLTGTF